MEDLLNKNFFNFVIGFMAILLVAFAIAAGVSYYDSSKKASELVELEASYQEGTVNNAL